MKRFDFRILFGLALFLLGGLMLLEQMGLIKGASSIFWGVTMIGLGSVFLYGFFGDFRRYWWMVIPGLTLVGVGVDSLLPQQLQSWGGVVLLAAIGLSFWSIYFVNRRSWWAIIPGGVLVTLAAVNLLDVMDLSIANNGGGVFFLGLGLTFMLVAVLPNGGANNQWRISRRWCWCCWGLFSATRRWMAFLPMSGRFR